MSSTFSPHPQIQSEGTRIASREPSQVNKCGSSSMAHAVAWTGAATWATQLITWICAITVARWLTPSDYGLIGMANVFLGLLTVANDFGLGAAVVVIPDLSKDQVSQ